MPQFKGRPRSQENSFDHLQFLPWLDQIFQFADSGCASLLELWCGELAGKFASQVFYRLRYYVTQEGACLAHLMIVSKWAAVSVIMIRCCLHIAWRCGDPFFGQAIRAVFIYHVVCLVELAFFDSVCSGELILRLYRWKYF